MSLQNQHFSIVEVVERIAKENPMNIAVTEEMSGRDFTYKELLTKATDLSQYLQSQISYPKINFITTNAETILDKTRSDDNAADGVSSNGVSLPEMFPGEETPLVALLTERGLCSIVSMLAVMKAGAAYVPIDPSFPEDRQVYIMQHSKCQCVIVEDVLLPRLQIMTKESTGPMPKIVVVNNESGALVPSLSELDLVNSNLPVSIPRSVASLAYVLYTSGSTGKPKGVMVRNVGLLNVVRFFVSELNITSKDVILCLTTFCFDISVLEVFMPLTSGGRLLLASLATQKNPVRIIETLSKYHVTLMQATPTTYEMMLSCGWNGDSFMRFLVGGEACRPKILGMVPHCGAIYNVYGPTETTIWSSCFKIPRDNNYGNSGVPIGAPISLTDFYLVSEEKQEMKGVDVEGELWIGGDGVALGYLHAPDLTEKRFIKNPFGQGIVYQTGDLFRRNADGSYIFVRRLDDQVKVAGFRIELGEVETALASHEGVDQAVAVVKGNQLYAFVHMNASFTAVDPMTLQQELIKFMVTKVPHYMVPHGIKFVDDFPKTANGKLDRLTMATLIVEPSIPVIPEADPALTNDISPDELHSHHGITMVAFIQKAIKSVNGQSPPANSSFAAVGIDSLAAMLFRNYLSQLLGGLTISADLLYDPETTVRSFSFVLWQRLQTENPSILQSLHITRPDELDPDLEHGLTDNSPKKPQPKNYIVSKLLLEKRVLAESLRGFAMVLILCDHFLFFGDNHARVRMLSDTSFFVVLTGFMTALSDIASEETQATTGKPVVWNAFAFLYSRFLGLFPIYWLVMFFDIPMIYVMETEGLPRKEIAGKILQCIFGVQSWWPGRFLAQISYVSLIWQVFILYAIFKTIFHFTDHRMFVRLVGFAAVIAFLIGSHTLYDNNLHPPLGFFYFFIGFVLAYGLSKMVPFYQELIASLQSASTRKYCLVPTNHQEKRENDHAPGVVVPPSLEVMLLEWLPSVTTDIAFVSLIVSLMFDSHKQNGEVHNIYDTNMMLYGCPLIFAFLMYSLFLQPSRKPSIFSYGIQKLSVFSLLGQCSLPIYIIQLSFVEYYWKNFILGIEKGQYPYTRRFEREFSQENPLFYKIPGHIKASNFILKWLGVALAIFFGVLLQKYYQEKLVVKLHIKCSKVLAEMKENNENENENVAKNILNEEKTVELV